MAKPSKSPKQKPKRLALLLETGLSFDRAIARGVGDYIHTHRGWVILMDPMLEVTADRLKHWGPDGIICMLQSDGLKAALELNDVPIVAVGANTQDVKALPDLPIITPNQMEIGRIAAGHFLDQGLKNFAFCSGIANRQAQWSREREQGFRERLAEEGYRYTRFEPPRGAKPDMTEMLKALSRWVRKLPKPTGVFVYFDGFARWVLDACVLEDISVPREIAVLGVDNDQWICDLSQPRLSSVDPNVEKIGYLAIELLATILHGGQPPRLSVVNPAGVVARESTEMMAFSDPDVAVAVRYIREHACDPIIPEEVLKVTGMSHSTAYRKFMKHLGRSVHSEIQRVQLQRMKELLTSTNLNISDIARQSGFENVRYMTKVFRDAIGTTPSDFRRAQSTTPVQASPNTRHQPKEPSGLIKSDSSVIKD